MGIIGTIRRETSRQFRNKKREYLKDKIDELATNSKNKNIRDLCTGIIEIEGRYQPRSNLVKDENCDLLPDSHNILNRWRKSYSQSLNVHRVINVRQTDIHTPQPLVPLLRMKLLLRSLKDSDQIQSELIQAGGKILYSMIHKHINSNWNKELPGQWKESIIVSVYKTRDITDEVIIVEYHSYQLHTKFYPI
jgi:hypothetical protein